MTAKEWIEKKIFFSTITNLWDLFYIANKPVSQSCAVATNERATGQSNLADRMEDCSIGQSVVV